MYGGVAYTELFYTIIPTLFLCCLLSALPTSCYIFNDFYSCILCTENRNG